jgi:hypothetical protein
MRPACQHRPVRSVSFEKPTSIIGVVEDKKPLSVLLVLQPVVNELKYVRLQVPPARDLDVVCDFPTTLFEPGGVARVYPENPCLWRLASDLVGVFDGELRLPSWELAFEMGVCRFYVPNPAQANQSSPCCQYRTPLE